MLLQLGVVPGVPAQHHSENSSTMCALGHAHVRATAQENAAALRELGVVPGVLAALRHRNWGPSSDVPALLARTLNNVFKQCAPLHIHVC